MLSLRALLRHPWQAALMVLGITLGVAVIISIDLANASAGRAFDLSTDAVAGKATHHIIASSPLGLDEHLYTRLRTDPFWREHIAMAPVVSFSFTSPQLGGQPFTLLGLDPFAEDAFRNYFPAENRLEVLNTLLQTGAVLLSRQTAERYGLQPCQPTRPGPSCQISLRIAGQEHRALLVGLLEPADAFSRRALQNILVTDIATAQQWGDMAGHLTRIDLIVPPERQTALQETLPPGVLLESVRTRSNAVRQMTAAFRTNLTALSLLALLVGLFLIYNTMTFSVVQRRPLFGTLRCLGFTRGQVFRMVLGEAALIGALGSLLGMSLGVLLGQGAVRLVTRTINDLFFVLTVRGVQVSLFSLLKGGVGGFCATLLAAAPPAWEAASVPPRLALSRTHLEHKAGRVIRGTAAAGGILILLGMGILSLPTTSLPLSFSGTFAIVIGIAMLTPLATGLLMHGIAPLLAAVSGLLGRMAARNVVKARSRTSVALAALMIAVSVTIGVSVMVFSFRATVSAWLEQTLQGDIYISNPGISTSQPGAPLPPDVLAQVQRFPQVAEAALLRSVTLETPDGPVEVSAVSDYTHTDPRLFLSAEGAPPVLWQAMQQGAVTISETLANRLGIPAHGGRLRLLTPQGWRTFPVVGVFSDYTSTQGSVRMSLDVYRSLWGDTRINGLALFLAPGTNSAQVTSALRTALSAYPDLRVRPSTALRQDALDVFDRTFAITSAMQLLTTLVAFIGVLSSLLALQLDKQRELGILRALGLTAAEMRRLVLWETGLMGTTAGLLSLPTGYILAWILIFIINKRSFGWTLQMQTPLSPFLQAVAVSLAAAILAGIYPAWRLSRMVTAQALRDE